MTDSEAGVGSVGTVHDVVPAGASLEWRLPVMIFALLAITVAAFGLLAFNEVRQSSTAAAISQLSTIVRQSVENSGRAMVVRLDGLEKQANNPIVTRVLAGNVKASDSLAAHNFLFTRRAQADSFVLLSQVVVSGDGQQRFFVGPSPDSDANDALTAAIANAFERDSASVSPFFANQSEVHYWIVAPVRTGTTRGYLAEHRRLPSLIGLDKQLRGLTGQEFSLYFANRAGNLWVGTAGKAMTPKFDLRATTDSFHVATDDGAKVIGVKGAISATPWVLVLAATDDAVNHRSIIFLRRMIVSALALLVAAILGAWWISRQVTKPLKSLTTAATAVADGDFARREVVKSDDELGQLAHAFNTMAERVGHSHTQLGGRIRESETLARELHNRNQELQIAQRLATDASNASDRARADAQRANYAKTEFLAMMSHELRTPLSAIAGYAEIMQLGMHGELNPKQRVDLERIQANQVHLLRIINDILDLTQVESGQMTVDLQAVALRDVVGDVEPIIRPLIDGRNLRYTVKPCLLQLGAMAERERLTQILVNLVANASRFTEAGGSITLHATAESGRVRIHVTDTGIGIPSDKHELIFQPFVQLDAGPSRQTQGTGLGLAISRRIAEAMGGTLSVSSEVGKGSTFTLELPGTEMTSSPAGMAQSPPTSNSEASDGKRHTPRKPHSALTH